jgi:hypothetical protein
MDGLNNQGKGQVLNMERRTQLLKYGALLLAIQAGLVIAAGAAPTARVNVKGNLEKNRDSSKSESEKSSTRNTTETSTYQLDIQVANTSKENADFDVEWYFIRRPLDNEGEKGDPVLCQKGKVTLPVGGQKRVLHKVASDPLTWSETKASKNSSSNNDSNKGGSSSSKSYSGDIFAGYVVLVRHAGTVLASQSNESKYTTEEWLAKLDGPIQKSSGKATTTSNSGKKKKKK